MKRGGVTRQVFAHEENLFPPSSATMSLELPITPFAGVAFYTCVRRLKFSVCERTRSATGRPGVQRFSGDILSEIGVEQISDRISRVWLFLGTPSDLTDAEWLRLAPPPGSIRRVGNRLLLSPPVAPRWHLGPHPIPARRARLRQCTHILRSGQCGKYGVRQWRGAAQTLRQCARALQESIACADP
jgi:hypothetical protein